MQEVVYLFLLHLNQFHYFYFFIAQFKQLQGTACDGILLSYHATMDHGTSILLLIQSSKLPPYFQDGVLNTSGDTDHDVPKFITDTNDKASYVRGKFLGKVNSNKEDIVNFSTPGLGILSHFLREKFKCYLTTAENQKCHAVIDHMSND